MIAARAGGVLVVLAVVATVVVAILGWVGQRRARVAFAAEVETLVATARRTTPRSQLDGLPEPVRRFAASAAPAGSIALVRLQQRGRLRASRDARWMPFEAEQVYRLDPPAFAWLARATIIPGISVWARDRFVDGEGDLRVRLLGLVSVADSRGPTIDQGAALRFWGEVVALPEVVVSSRLRWEPRDDRSARLIAAQGDLRVEATVEFDVEARPIAVHADRYREVDGRGVLTPWSGTFADWRRFGDREFPARWSSIWHLADGDLVAVELEIVGLAVEDRSPLGRSGRASD
jgi:hypothetical protein